MCAPYHLFKETNRSPHETVGRVEGIFLSAWSCVYELCSSCELGLYPSEESEFHGVNGKESFSIAIRRAIMPPRNFCESFKLSTVRDIYGLRNHFRKYETGNGQCLILSSP